jgi:hypothetical protein
MAFEDTLLERIKKHSAEVAAIRKKESRKRRNEKYWEKNKSLIAEYKRSKKDSIAAVNHEYYEKNKNSIAERSPVHPIPLMHHVSPSQQCLCTQYYQLCMQRREK